MEFENDLLDQLLSDANGIDGDGSDDFKELDDGTYYGHVHNASFGKNKDGINRFMFEIILEDNRHVWISNVLKDAKRTKKLITILQKFDVDTTCTDSIIKDVPEFVLNREVEVTVTRGNSGFVNKSIIVL